MPSTLRAVRRPREGLSGPPSQPSAASLRASTSRSRSFPHRSTACSSSRRALVVTTQAAQQLAADARQQVGPAQAARRDQLVDHRERRRGTLRHREGDRAVQLDDGRRRQPPERLVEHARSGPSRSPRPTGRPRGTRRSRPGRRTHPARGPRGRRSPGPRVRAGSPTRSHRRRSCSSSSTGSPSSRTRAGNRAAVSSRSASRPWTSGSSGTSCASDAGQPDRLVREVLPDPVAARRRRRALREDQVEDVQHRRQPFAAFVGRRHLERDLRRAERLLRAGDPGLDRGRRHQERPGDLVAGQTADHAQRQRDLRLARQHRVARDEHQRQHVVVDPVRVPEHVVARTHPRPGRGRGRRTARRARRAAGTCRSRADDPP